MESYRDGMSHGTGRQWSADGKLLVTWKLVRGVGMDLWCDSQTGKLKEEYYCAGEGELGYKREWNGDEATVWEEYFYIRGRGYHGVWREWNAKGRLKRGFPHFYLNDRRVTKRQYLQACESDPTLRPYRPAEDKPQRKLPAEYLAQRKKRR